jgi:isopenicillin N synthase-like dioxygenase
MCRNVVATARDFFASPAEQKLQAVSKDKARRGYSPINTENFASLIGNVASNDIVEKFRIGPLETQESKESDVASSDYYSTKSGRIYFFENAWAGTSAELQTALTTVYATLSPLARDLLSALAIGINLPANYFTEKMYRQTSIMSVNCYSDRHTAGFEASPDSCLRVHEHTDVSLLTLVLQSDRGLQIKNKSTNTWETVECVPGSLFVHVGDCLQYWSRNRFHSTVHRVIVNSKESNEGESTEYAQSKDRISLAYFTTPDYDAVLDWPLAVLPLDICDSAVEGTGADTADPVTTVSRPGSKQSKVNKKYYNSDDPLGYDEVLTFDVWRKKKIAQSIACCAKNKK